MGLDPSCLLNLTVAFMSDQDLNVSAMLSWGPRCFPWDACGTHALGIKCEALRKRGKQQKTQLAWVTAIHFAAFSAIINVGELVFPLVMVGMALASTTRKP